MSLPPVKKLGSKWEGEVVAISENGDLLTNVRTHDVDAFATVSHVWIEFSGSHPPIRDLFPNLDEAQDGKLLALGGGRDYVTLAVKNGHAAQVTGLQAGDKITFTFRT